MTEKSHSRLSDYSGIVFNFQADWIKIQGGMTSQKTLTENNMIFKEPKIIQYAQT